MKQLEKDKLCNYCIGCNLLEIDTFNGIRNCWNFEKYKDNWYEEYYKELLHDEKKIKEV